MKNTGVKNLLKEAAKKDTKKSKGDADDLKAIQTALEFEAKCTEYYTKLRNEAADPKEKAFFGLLASIEHEHYVSLRDTELYMIDPATWFKEKEDPSLNDWR